MTVLYDTKAKKRATSLTINSDLIKIAKEYKINLSNLLETNLIELIKEKQAQQWQEENKEAIEEQNQRIKDRGLFSDSVRKF
ncbi:MAG: type II toxin-antitoxin system CcdA family antitoxin [Campylobacterales bacterium]|nr:type II toxin-antitoxin system CcdA family antitoxin [Campylobacterales bacterium]